MANGRQKRVLLGHSDRLNSCAIASTGTWAAAAGDDGSVLLFKPTTGEILRSLVGHADRVTHCAIDPRAQWLATAADDGAVRVWSAASGTSRELATNQDRVNFCAISPDGKHLATAGGDGTLRSWDAETFEPELTMEAHVRPVTACAYSPDGRWLASVGDDHCLRIWDVAIGKQATSMRVDGGLADVHWLPSGIQICTVGAGGIYLFAFDPPIDEERLER